MRVSLSLRSFEVALLLIIYIAYGYTDGGASSFVLLTISSWFLVISWLFAPYIFNPSGFEWQKLVLCLLLGVVHSIPMFN